MVFSFSLNWNGQKTSLRIFTIKTSIQYMLADVKHWRICQIEPWCSIFKHIVNGWTLERCLWLGIMQPWYEPQAEHSGIHGNPESGICQPPSNWQSQWRYLPVPSQVKDRGPWEGAIKHTAGMNGHQGNKFNKVKVTCNGKLHVLNSWQAKYVSPAKPVWVWSY